MFCSSHKSLSSRLSVGAAVLLVCGWYTAPAWADDSFHPFAALSYSYDDNLFRVPDDSPGYDNQRGDRSRMAQGGLLFNHTYGREVVNLQAKVSRVTFDHFTQLDYNGKDLLADLGWHMGNHVDGTLGVSYTEVLAPYTDVSTRERNVRKVRNEYASANWAVHPSWRLRVAGSSVRSTYDLSTQAYNNRTDDALETGLDYGVSSGSTLGVQVREARTDYDLQRLVGNQLVDAGSRQRDIKLRAYWKVTGVTDLLFLGGWAKRTHAFFTEQDSSGVNARLVGNTVFSGSTALTASAWHEYAGAENNVVSYSLNTGASAGATWTASSKLQATAQWRYERRNFKGYLLQTLGLDLYDTNHNTSVGLVYVPTRLVQLNLSAYRETRGGVPLLGYNSYHSNGMSLTASLQY